jgi:hypothetical protein
VFEAFHLAHETAGGIVDDRAADQIAFKKITVRQRAPLAFRYPQIGSAKSFRGGDRIDPGELQNPIATVRPNLIYLNGDVGAIRQSGVRAFEIFHTTGNVGLRLRD